MKRINKNNKVVSSIIIIALLVLMGIILLAKNQFGDEHSQLNDTKIEIESDADVLFDLGDDLAITQIGKYSGVYMEDGTDEIVSDILMIVVRNMGDQPLQYTEIYLNTGESIAEFSLSTLPAGESVVVLEKNRMNFEDIDFIDAKAMNTVWFQEELSLYEELFQIQTIEGTMNIKNISNADVTEDIVIYYKNYSKKRFYGGITYRVRLTGGMKVGEIKQINPTHFLSEDSKVMFITRG